MSDQVHILEELALPDSNTWAPCEAFLQRLARLRPSSQCFTPVLIYGDATGNARPLRRAPTGRLYGNSSTVIPIRLTSVCVLSSNPAVTDPVNCVNAMLHNQAGARRLLVDPGCEQLIADFERVLWKVDLHWNKFG